jgi:Tfp pilus assembly protein PilX
MKRSHFSFQRTLFTILLNLQKKQKSEGGYVLVVVMGMVLALSTMLITAALTSKVDSNNTRASSNIATGFYAAEAGLNLRAKEIRSTFNGYNRPSGTSPTDWATCRDRGWNYTRVTNNHFDCDNSQTFQGKRVSTFVLEDPTNPTSLTINRGELFGGLNAQEYRYDVTSVAFDSQNEPTASLQMRFKSRLIPLFQFAAFYDKDLEILPGPDMTLSGPVHTNGDLYLNAGSTLTVQGQISTTGNLYRRRKNNNDCGGTVRASSSSSTTATTAIACSGQITNVTPWNNQIRINLPRVDVPPPEALDPIAGSTYWDSADLRVMLTLDSSGNPSSIDIKNANGSTDGTRSSRLESCGSPLATATADNSPFSTSNQIYNFREGKNIRMLNVNVLRLLNCIKQENLLESGRALDDTTENGLVFHFSVDGPNDNVNVPGGATDGNPYGIKLSNGSRLESNLSGAPTVKGLTVVTDQALYVQGDYNCVWVSGNCNNKKPAAFLADSLNVLSNSWNDANNGSSSGLQNASETRINAAFLAGTDVTGGQEGASGQNNGNYNGGLENYPRFHENWGGQTLRYRGSFVSLNRPRRVDGSWGSQRYAAPLRDWNYDTDFNNAANLPPLSPRFVYLRQERFSREFERRASAWSLPNLFASISPWFSPKY